jgi:hypothetical protein
MRTPFLTVLVTATLLLLGLAWLATPAFAAPAAKVQICHIPPDDPDNFHTINVSENALPAHLAHGDPGGACDENCHIVCDEGDACTIAECDPNGACVPADPVDCDDGDACTSDSCDSASGCGNVPVVCSAPDLCTVSMCASDTGECVDSPVMCGEGQTCNLDNGVCEDATDPSACPCARLWIDGCGEAPSIDTVNLATATCSTSTGIPTGSPTFNILVRFSDPSLGLYAMTNGFFADVGVSIETGGCTISSGVGQADQQHSDIFVGWFDPSENIACQDFLIDRGCVFE